jgi:hypothetical protein
MDISDVIAVAALIISILAYQRTGGTAELKRKIEATISPEDLKKQVENLASMTDSLRERTADALDRLERVLRKTEKGQ